MPYYADLNPKGRLGRDWRADPQARERAVARLLTLREALPGEEGVPPRSLTTLLLATWNIREFDSSTWGPRLPEAYAYMAEIVDRFDLVALQEVRDDLTALEQLRFRLGTHWEYLVSDVTEGRAGNRERLAFLYDGRKVRFLGMAGELVLPPVETREGDVPATQIARTPMMAAFQVGWTKFVLATVHVVYGESTAEPVARVEEIRQIARFLRRRTEQATEPIRNFLLLGDFNIFSESDATMRALVEDGGFTIPEGISAIPGTNVPKNKKYDQIAYRARQDRFQATGNAGVFDFYKYVFTVDEADTYRPYLDAYIDARHAAGKKSPKAPADAAAAVRQFGTWRTYQMSDHLPLWAEFRVDFADEYLARLIAEGRAGGARRRGYRCAARTSMLPSRTRTS
jgi:endonuclease/exonuclease/phosphatase family metal-dependent hydrolase